MAVTVERLEKERQAKLKALFSGPVVPTARQLQREQLAQLTDLFKSFDPAVQEVKSLEEALGEVAAAAQKGGAEPLQLRLNLTMQRLLAVPAGVCKLDSLVELSIVGNQICELPAALGKCWRLRVLNAGANELKSLPKLTKTILMHAGLSCNLISDDGLARVINHLPATAKSLDLGTNLLCRLSGALDALKQMPQLAVLGLRGNPCCIKPGFRDEVWRTLGQTLTSLDGASIEALTPPSPSVKAVKEAVSVTDNVAVAATPQCGQAAPTDAPTDALTEADDQPSGVELPLAVETEEHVRLQVRLDSIEGIQVIESKVAGEPDTEVPPRELKMSVSFTLLGQTHTTALVEAIPSVNLNESFDLRVPIGARLRDELVGRGVDLVVRTCWTKLSDEGGEDSTQEMVGNDTLVVIPSRWGAIFEGNSETTVTQQCTAQVQPEPKVHSNGKRGKLPPAYTVTITVSCTVSADQSEEASSAP